MKGCSMSVPAAGTGCTVRDSRGQARIVVHVLHGLDLLQNEPAQLRRRKFQPRLDTAFRWDVMQLRPPPAGLQLRVILCRPGHIQIDGGEIAQQQVRRHLQQASDELST